MRHFYVSAMALVAIVLAPSALADLLVSSRLSNKILRYTNSGAPLGVFADASSGLFTPNGLVLGRDGFVYAASRAGGQTLRYVVINAALDSVFAQGPEMVAP